MRRPEPVIRSKAVTGVGCGFILWFIFCAALGLGLLGVIVWAIIRLVVHFT